MAHGFTDSGDAPWMIEMKDELRKAVIIALTMSYILIGLNYVSGVSDVSCASGFSGVYGVFGMSVCI